jgi:hypothetical protein
MSLKDVVLEIADEMGRYEEDDKVINWAKQLKLICKVAGDEPQKQDKPTNWHQEWYNKAQEEAKAQANRARKAVGEEHLPVMTLCLGGENDNLSVPTEPEMPTGAKTLIAGQVYVMSQERKLVFSAKETKKLANQLKEVEAQKKVLVS